jgi:hypothetical protein
MLFSFHSSVRFLIKVSKSRWKVSTLSVWLRIVANRLNLKEVFHRILLLNYLHSFHQFILPFLSELSSDLNCRDCCKFPNAELIVQNVSITEISQLFARVSGLCFLSDSQACNSGFSFKFIFRIPSNCRSASPCYGSESSIMLGTLNLTSWI